MKRPTNRYAEPKRPLLERVLVRGTLLLLMAAVIGTLSGVTERVKASEEIAPGGAESGGPPDGHAQRSAGVRPR